MPTATTTLTEMGYTPPIPLKASKSPISPAPAPISMVNSTTDATLRTLYHRAATSFLHRDVALTSSLIDSAFALVQPPASPVDPLAEQRRKWDILRITLESTVYTTPPPSLDDLPGSLRENLIESPQSLMTKLYNRSLALFTPSSSSTQKSVLNAAYLPPPVLVTLVYASLKVDSPDTARIMIEDWLAKRESPLMYGLNVQEGDGYEKILELYCLHVLPRLEQWEYAKEFLDYESELPDQSREHLKTSLKNLHVQVIAARRPVKAFPGPSTSPSSSSTPRPYSPTPSASSSSSSLSTTSTHTIVPSTPRPHKSPYTPSALTSQAQSSSTSLSSDTTATPHSRSKGKERSRSHTRRATSSSRSSGLSLPRSNIQTSAVTPSSPTTYTLIKASLAPYLTTSRISTFIILFVLLPLVSFVLRLRRRRRLIGGPRSTVSSGAGSNVELVRRRLQAGSESGIMGRIWGEAVRAMVDTVKMAGSGLV